MFGSVLASQPIQKLSGKFKAGARPSKANTEPSTAAEEQLSNIGNKEQINKGQEVEDEVVRDKHVEDEHDKIPMRDACRRPVDARPQSTNVEINSHFGEVVNRPASETDGTPAKTIQVNVTITFFVF